MPKSNFRLGNKIIDVVKLGSNDAISYLGETKMYPLSKPIDDAIVTCDTTTYNGSNQTAQSITVTLSGVTLVQNTDYTVISNTGGTNAGNYTVTVQGINEYEHTASGTFTINKVTPTVTAPTAKVLTYNGSAQALVNAGSTNFGTLKYSLDNSTYNTNIPSGTNATSYTVYYRVDGDSNVNDVAATTIACSIAKAPTCAVAPSATTYTYANTARALVSGGSSSCGTMKYATTSTGTYTTTIPSQTDAGTYTTYWKVENDSNHSGTSSGSVSTTINKAAMTYTAPVAATRTYTGAAQQIVSGQSANGGSIYFATSSAGASSSTTVPTQTNTGTSYNTYWKAVPDSNHSGGTSTWAQITGCTINTASLTITAKAQTISYGGSITTGTGQVTTTGLVNGDSLTSITLTPSTSNVPGGVITPSAGATTKGIGNYSVTYKTGTLTINKVAMSYVAPKVTTYTYANTARALVSGASAVGGSIQYCATSGGTYSTTVPTQTNAGTYTTWWKAVPDSNHSGGTSAASASTTIKCYSATAPTAKSLTWTGSAQALVNAGSTAYGTMVYCTTSGGTFSTTIPTGTNAGSYEVWWKVTGNTNVCNTAATKVSCSIAKVAMSYVAPKAATRSYTGSAQQIVSGQSATGGAIYFATSSAGASSSTTVPTQTNAGSYTTYWKAVPDSNHSGGTSTWASISCSIAKVAMSYVAPKAAVRTYTGAAQQIVSGASATGGSIQYCSTSGGTYSTTVPTQTNTGTSYSTWWKAVPDSNHSGGTSAAQITGCKINKASLTITAKAQTINYGSSITTGTGQTTTSGLVSGDALTAITLTQSTTSVTTSGKITPSAGATTKGIGNYNVTYNTGTLTINKVAMTYSAPKAAVRTYNGSAQQIVSGQSAAGGSIQYCSTSGGTYTTTVPTQTNAGTSYSTWWKAVPDSNHSGGTNPAQITGCKINQAATCGTAPTAKSLTYSGKAQALVNAGSSTCGTMQYCATASGTYSTAIPSGTTAGTYTTYWKVANDANHSGTSSGSVSTTIAKKTGCAISFATTAVTKTYGDAAFTNAITNGGDSTVTWSAGTTSVCTVSSAGKVTIKGAGTCVIKATVANTSNCTYSTTAATYTITVAKAATCGTAPTAKSLTWTGSAQALLNAGSSTCGTMQYCATASGTYSTTIPTGTAATGYTSYWKVANDANHSGTSSGSVSTTIAKKTGCKISFGTTAVTKNYGDAAFTNAITNTGDGSITWSSSNTGICTINTSGKVTIKAAGSCTISAKTSNTNNCTYSTTAATYTITVNKVAMSYTAPSAATRTYTGSAQQIVSGGSATGGAIYYATASGGTGSATTVPTETAAGTYNRWWKAVPDSNHSGGTSSWAKIASTISPKTVSSPTITLSPTGYTYSGSACKPTPTVKDGSTTIASTEYTVSYSNNTNAGTATCTITDKSGGNYTVSGSKTFTIAKAATCATAPKATTYTYNGSARALVSGGSSTCGTMQYCATASGTYSTTVPTQTNANTYTTYWKVANDANHSGTSSGSVSTTISKASGSVSTAPTAKSLKYTGSSQQLINAGSGTGTMLYKLGSTESGSWTSTISSIAATNIGSYTVYYKASASTNYNESASGSVTCKIDYNYVDLGLPSGTKWATTNIGAANKYSVGAYFSWGNVAGHAAGAGYNFNQTTYNSTSGAGLTGNIAVGTTYDAARKIMGGSWRMPTAQEFSELFLNCTYSWYTDSASGIKGINMVSKKNGNSIFIPAAGYYNGTTLTNNNKISMLWSSNIGSPTSTMGMIGAYGDGSTYYAYSNWSRYQGLNIRGVQ